MHVQREIGRTPDGLDHGYADAEIRHEVPVHDVQVQHLCPARLDTADFLAHSREVARQQRRCDQWSDGM